MALGKEHPQEVRAFRDGKHQRLIIVLDNGKHVSSQIPTKLMSPTMVAQWLEDIAKNIRLHCAESECQRCADDRKRTDGHIHTGECDAR